MIRRDKINNSNDKLNKGREKYDFRKNVWIRQ